MGWTKIDSQSHFVTDWLETWGEVGRAFLVVADGYDEDKLPRSIIVLDAMPLTAIGKLDKKQLTSKEAPE